MFPNTGALFDSTFLRFFSEANDIENDSYDPTTQAEYQAALDNYAEMSDYDGANTYINECFFEAEENFLSNNAYADSMIIFLFMTDGQP